MLKRTIGLIALLMVMALIPLPVQGAADAHLFWDIPPTIKTDELIALVQERSGITMEESSYGDSVYLSSGISQSITMFGMPVRLTAGFENDVLGDIVISCIGQNGMFLYEGIAPTAEQLDEAVMKGISGFLEIAKQVEEKYGKFVGGQKTEVGEAYADFPVDAQGALDMAAARDSMWYSNESAIELCNENILIELRSFFEHSKDGDPAWCLDLRVSFAYNGSNSQERVRTFSGAYPDWDALAASLSGDHPSSQAADERVSSERPAQADQTVKSVHAGEAVIELLCKAYELTYETGDGMWAIYPDMADEKTFALGSGMFVIPVIAYEESTDATIIGLMFTRSDTLVPDKLEAVAFSTSGGFGEDYSYERMEIPQEARELSSEHFIPLGKKALASLDTPLRGLFGRHPFYIRLEYQGDDIDLSLWSGREWLTVMKNVLDVYEALADLNNPYLAEVDEVYPLVYFGDYY